VSELGLLGLGGAEATNFQVGSKAYLGCNLKGPEGVEAVDTKLASSSPRIIAPSDPRILPAQVGYGDQPCRGITARLIDIYV